MKFVSVLLLGLLAATAVLASPPRVEGEAEVVGRTNKGGSEGSEGSGGGISTGDGVYAYIPGLRDFGTLRNFFNRIFGIGRPERNEGTTAGGSEAATSEGEEGQTSDGNSERGIIGFGDLFGFNSFLPVFRHKEYNVTYSNTTQQVVKYGGVPMVVNKTIEERKAEDGSVYFSVITTLVGPYNSTETDGEGFPTEQNPATDDGLELELVEEQPSMKLKHSLTKRWIVSWLHNKLAKRENSETETSDNDLAPRNSGNTNTLEKEKEEERATGNTLTYIGDTDVNFHPSPLRALNPDAEVFDPTLMREAENEFFERRYEHSEPLRSQPMRSEPLSSQPLSSRPIRMLPLRFQPSRMQPLSSQPIRTHSRHSQPLSSHPRRSEAIVSQPIRSQPLRYQPLVSRTPREGYRRV